MNTTKLVRGAATTGVFIFSAAALAQQAPVPSAGSAGGGAIAACNGKQIGTQSSYIGSNGERIAGMCEMIGGKLAVRSTGMPTSAPAAPSGPMVIKR